MGFRFCSLLALCALLTTFQVNAKQKKSVISLTDGNWTEMLEGQWLVKFYAPWCPACQAMESDWIALSTWQDDLNFKCGEVDVSDNPALSGRFLVTSLPTVYHVQDGVFRKYSHQLLRDEKSFLSYIDNASWKTVEPLPWYSDPTSTHMALAGQFFRLSLSIRDLHNRMTSEYGIPVWGSYIAFAILTIFVGLIMGLCCVCVCDCCCPPSAPPPRKFQEPTQYSKAPPVGYKKDDGDDDQDKEAVSGAAEGGATGGDVRPKTGRKRAVQRD